MDRIESTPVIVNDKAEALNLFTEKLGFEKKVDVTDHGYRWVTVGPKGQNMQLELWQVGSYGHAEPSKSWRQGNSIPVVLLVDDCYKTFAESKAKMVQFKREPEEYQHGVSATLSDLDGDLSTIRELPRRKT